jgi:hypothetical protein
MSTRESHHLVTQTITSSFEIYYILFLTSAVILRSEPRGTHDHILLSQIRDSPNLEGHVQVFISPRNRMARLYPHSPGSLYAASYDSQGYGGGIQPRLHRGDLECVLQ